MFRALETASDPTSPTGYVADLSLSGVVGGVNVSKAVVNVSRPKTKHFPARTII